MRGSNENFFENLVFMVFFLSHMLQSTVEKACFCACAVCVCIHPYGYECTCTEKALPYEVLQIDGRKDTNLHAFEISVL